VAQFVDILSGAMIVLFFSSLIYFGFQMEMRHPINPKPFLMIIKHKLSDPGSLVNLGFVLLCILFGIFILWQAYYLKKLTKRGYLFQLIISGILFIMVANTLGKLVQVSVIFFMLMKQTRQAFRIGK